MLPWPLPHCLKLGGVAVEVHETITTETATLFSSIQDRDEEDLFSDLEEDESKLEEMKLV